ncbi:MAG: hypothetical protein KTQ49_00305 [Candidatus Omnitrophica bacterium]|nr:hypothetical protein [Candidatus Omnitrophota bacterium]
MDYFKVAGLILGMLMFLGGLAVSVFPGAVRSRILRAYPERRPPWLLAVAAVILALTLWTWFRFVTGTAMAAFVVTLVISLSALKVTFACLFYKKFRETAQTLMQETLAFRVVMLSSAAVGAALLFLAFLI